jgi:hypothetical protein
MRWLALLLPILVGIAAANGYGLYSYFFAPHAQHVPVADEAGLLAPAEEQYIHKFHSALVQDFAVDLTVVTLPGQVDVAREAVKKFEQYEVGKYHATDRGLLLLIAPQSNAVRLEVSQSLEGIYTDAFVNYLQTKQMAPFFKSGRVTDGIAATIELIYARAAAAQKGEAFDARQFEAQSAGGGAQMAANIGTGYNMDTLQQRRETVAAARDPQGTVKAYLSAMALRDGRPDLPVYSQGSRAMMAKWTVTAAQMDNIVKTYKECPAPELKIVAENKLAVLRYPPVREHRACSPWFLIYEDGAWRLDLTMMQRALLFNTRNQWHFNRSGPQEYAPAFTDWEFDENGYGYLPGGQAKR